MRSRSFRRHQRDKKMKKAKEIVSRMFFAFPRSEEELNLMAAKRHKNLKICSCYMCGNERKWFGNKTLQEIKFEADDGCE